MCNFRFSGARLGGAIFLGMALNGCAGQRGATAPAETNPLRRTAPLSEGKNAAPGYLCHGDFSAPKETIVEIAPTSESCISETIEKIAAECRKSDDPQGCIASKADKGAGDTIFVKGYFQYVTPVGGDVLRMKKGGFLLGMESSLTVKAVTAAGVEFYAYERECVNAEGIASAGKKPGDFAGKGYKSSGGMFSVSFDGEVSGDSTWLQENKISNIKVQNLGDGKVRVGFRVPVPNCGKGGVTSP
jgi:hypothetical protein